MRPTRRRALLAGILAASALVAAGCSLVAVRLPERVDEEEFQSRARRVPPGDEIEFLSAQPGGSPAPDRLWSALMSDSRGPYGYIGGALRPDGPPIRWTIEKDGTTWTDGRGGPICMSPLTMFSLGIIPQYDSFESVSFYRVRREGAPASEELWVGVPGPRGRIVGFAALLFSLFEGWELEGREHPDLDQAIADRFVHDLNGFQLAVAEGRAPTTDPEVLERLAEARRRRSSGD